MNPPLSLAAAERIERDGHTKRDAPGEVSHKIALIASIAVTSIVLSVKPQLTFRRSSGDFHLPPTLPSRQPAGHSAAFLQLRTEPPGSPA